MKSESDNDNTAVAKTIADQTYQHIRRDIISGALPPGTKLAMEMLTKRYDVGLSPLREALVKLTGDALAVAEGQRGFWVSQISLDELQDTMNTRLLIETQALSLAMEKGGPEWERAVNQAYEELSSLEDHLKEGDNATFARWESANRRFHEALVSACGSKWLIRLRSMLHYHSERYRMISLAEASVERDVHDEHEAIVEAVLGRKTLRACRLTELHLQRTTEVVRAALERRDEELLNKNKKRSVAGRRPGKPRA
ncbi:GntR family transcriptional regulator [Steroidobacter flavus]|uniref:GntR family transcriptional regulator n=1 Tax=Steroidobacter flavus TaxID=1842136 RepID=A0ABV8SX29_9GAMM